MSTVTNIVNRLLDDDMQDIIDSPNKAYKALQDQKLLEAPSMRLKKTLCKLLNEKEEAIKDILATCYYEFQVSQDKNFKFDTAKQYAVNWLEKNTVPKRETVFEICFSLQKKLYTVDAVKELITTGFGKHGFTVRSAKECVYFYCFASGKSYADAQRILGEYGEAEVCESGEGRYCVESGKGNTTLLLRRQLLNNEWDTEERFKEFLLDNKPLFIGFSRSFVREYKELYLKLSPKIKLYGIKKEFDCANDADAFFHLVKREASDCIEKDERLSKLYEMYLNAKKNASVDALSRYYSDNQSELHRLWDLVIMPQITEKAKKSTKPISANKMAQFISRGIPRGKREQRATDYNSNQQRNSPKHAVALTSREFSEYEERAKNTDSKLYQSESYGVMAAFPYRKDIIAPGKIENALSASNKKNPFDSLHYRKLFLIMFYYNYFFDAFCYSAGQSSLQTQFDFHTFVSEITETLYRCNMAPLYRNDHFDWLILNSAATIADGYIPPHVPDEDEGYVYIAERIAEHLDNGCKHDDYVAICEIIEDASVDEIRYLYDRFPVESSDDIDEIRSELINLFTDDADGTAYQCV